MNLKTEGKWEQVKGRIKEAWGSLTDDDLDRTEGRWEQLVGTIKERTGETAESIDIKLKRLIGNSHN